MIYQKTLQERIPTSKKLVSLFFFWFNIISTFMGYLMPKPSLWYYLIHNWEGKGGSYLSQEYLPKSEHNSTTGVWTCFSHYATGSPQCKKCMKAKENPTYKVYIVFNPSFFMEWIGGTGNFIIRLALLFAKSSLKVKT